MGDVLLTVLGARGHREHEHAAVIHPLDGAIEGASLARRQDHMVAQVQHIVPTHRLDGNVYCVADANVGIARNVRDTLITQPGACAVAAFIGVYDKLMLARGMPAQGLKAKVEMEGFSRLV